MPNPADVRPMQKALLRSSGHPFAGFVVVGVFMTTLAFASFLLFVVQPMAGKAVLPTLGGVPAVWTTCMAFFQTALLVGYAYAHLLMRITPSHRRQAVIHLLLLAIATALAVHARVLAEIGDEATGSFGPIPWLIGTLLETIGLPFVILSATAPMLQRWYTASGTRSYADPYFLYASSNLGSLIALLAYPVAIEPFMTLEIQADLWWIAVCVLFGLTGFCALATSHHASVSRHFVPEVRSGTPLSPCETFLRWVRWFVLAFIPSSYLLGVTSYLSTDIAAVPMLWVVPLGLYLLSLISAFARPPIPPHSWSIRVFPVLALLLTPALAAGLVQPLWIPLHLTAFLLGALVCHGELVKSRPAARQLTLFYLAMAAGGAAGGLFNSMIAPWAFDRVAEYPISLVLALLGIPRRGQRPDSHHKWSSSRSFGIPVAVFLLGGGLALDLAGLASSVLGALILVLVTGLVTLAAFSMRTQPRRFTLTLGAVLLASGLSSGVDGRTELRTRNFFGVLRVTYDDQVQLRRLFHGSTLHGQQSVDPARRDVPLSYFHPSGPIGDVFESNAGRNREGDIAVVGLGIGSLAAYSRPGENWTFYELDPAVEEVARDPRFFTYLNHADSDRIRISIGDARVRLKDAPDGAYELIVLDAFSSDALPVHLMTREALQVYRRKLAPGGLLAFNLSNRYLDLDPVLGSLARDAGMICRIRAEIEIDPEMRRQGKLPSIWGILANSEADLGPLVQDPSWKPASVLPGGRVWTDQWSSLLLAWRWR